MQKNNKKMDKNGAKKGLRATQAMRSIFGQGWWFPLRSLRGEVPRAQLRPYEHSTSCLRGTVADFISFAFVGFVINASPL